MPIASHSPGQGSLRMNPGKLTRRAWTSIDACHENGIEPFVTCYHWDLPQYLEEKGGWLNKATAAAFQHYCEVVFKAFNGLVDHWTTFNAPKWFVFSGYMSGNYPPCHKNPQEVVNAAYNVMYANALAVKSFKELGILGSIGIVTSYQTIYGIDDSEACQLAFRNADNYCNNWIIDTACSGAFPSDMVAKLAAEGFDLSIAQPEELQLIKNNTVQFLGMNYYSPQFVKPYTGGETDVKVNNLGKNYKGNMRTVVKNWFEVANDDMTELPRNDWGMIIYPQGLREGLRRNSAKFSGPIYVTENGFGNYEDIHNGPVLTFAGTLCGHPLTCIHGKTVARNVMGLLPLISTTGVNAFQRTPITGIGMK